MSNKETALKFVERVINGLTSTPSTRYFRPTSSSTRPRPSLPRTAPA
jgi:hypothetical protein